MLYTMIYNTNTEETETRIFYSYAAIHAATFSPDLEAVIINTERGPAGKTYREKKERLEGLAIEYSNSWGADHVEEMSYNELYELQQYFNKWGRRYGLLKEFRENCIC